MRQGRRQGARERGRRLAWRAAPSLIGRRSESPGGLLGGRGVIGLGRGRAGVVGAWRQPQVGEDGAHDSRVLDGGDDPQPAAALGTSQDIETC